MSPMPGHSQAPKEGSGGSPGRGERCQEETARALQRPRAAFPVGGVKQTRLISDSVPRTPAALHLGTATRGAVISLLYGVSFPCAGSGGAVALLAEQGWPGQQVGDCHTLP